MWPGQVTIEIDSLSEVIGYSCSLFRARVKELGMDYFSTQGAEQVPQPDEAVGMMLQVQGGIITGEGPSRGQDPLL